MTKAVTSAAAMQLVEQGKLALDGPIAETLPELAAPQVLEGFDAAGEPRLRPARRPITLRHLITHTAGFCYQIWNADSPATSSRSGSRDRQLPQRRARVAADLRPRRALGLRHQHRLGRPAVERASGQRLGAYFARAPVRAARHEGHPFQADPRASRPARGDARPRRRRRSGADPVRSRAGAGVRDGRRRALQHGGRLSCLCAMFLNDGRAADGAQVLKPETVR